MKLRRRRSSVVVGVVVWRFYYVVWCWWFTFYSCTGSSNTDAATTENLKIELVVQENDTRTTTPTLSVCPVGSTVSYDYYSNNNTTTTTTEQCYVSECFCNNTTTTNTNTTNTSSSDTTTLFIANVLDHTRGFTWIPEVIEFTYAAWNEGWWWGSYTRNNTNTNITTKNTQLEYALVDSQCDSSIAARAYWSVRENRIKSTSQQQSPIIHAVIGATCSGSSLSVARITELEQIPQISPMSTSSKLTSKVHFPYFSRMVPPDDIRGEAGALVVLLQYFQWNRVTIISTNTEFARDFVTDFTNAWTTSTSTSTSTASTSTTDNDNQEQEQEQEQEQRSIAYSATIPITPQGNVDLDVVQQVLTQGVPTDNPQINSRIILLIAHDKHAYPILQLASDLNFQPNSIWVGPSSWVNRGDDLFPTTLLTLSNSSSYLGIANYFNRDSVYQEYLHQLQTWQQQQNEKEVWKDLPSFYVGYVVDSIVAMAMALTSVPISQRHNGTAVTEALRLLEFQGVSGPVKFTSEGDRKDPLYTIFNLHPTNNGTTSTIWHEIGITSNPDSSSSSSTTTTTSTTELYTNATLCLATVGCQVITNDDNNNNKLLIPSDRFSLDSTSSSSLLPTYAIFLIALPLLALTMLAVKYHRSKRSKSVIKAELDVFRDSIVGMRTAIQDVIPTLPTTMALETTTTTTTTTTPIAEQAPTAAANNNNNNNQITTKTTATTTTTTTTTVQWYWRDQGSKDENDNDGSSNNEWIPYDTDVNAELEAAFQEQGGKGTFSLLQRKRNDDSQQQLHDDKDVVTVNLETMQSAVGTTNLEGGTRKLKRCIQQTNNNDDDTITCTTTTNNNNVKNPPPPPLPYNNRRSSKTNNNHKNNALVPPEELQNEPQMLLMKGDIVQISKKRTDGWAFGTKLHHADESAARELLFSVTAKDGEGEESAANAWLFTDTGWFPLHSTRVPTRQDLMALRNTVGKNYDDARALLDVPLHWDPVKDPTIVQLHELKQGHPERNAVVDDFLSTLNPGIEVVKVERVQHLAMWQTYVVKRQAICYRETGFQQQQEQQKQQQQAKENNAKSLEDIRQKALERFEKRWLWHGTDLTVMDKVLQQGFNRSFCGKHATMYGKGVYFARDAFYATSTAAAPDADGHYRVLACRVVVGEYCRGRKDALTPGIRDVKSQSLYDSTVDSKTNPTVYVTYHDAQAYPEYLITYKE